MYLILITASLCISYFVLMFFLGFFFEQRQVKINSKVFVSLFFIFVLSCVGYAVAFSIHDDELGNRVLHAFGGGFMTFLVYFFAIRDGSIAVSTFQFFTMGILVVCALGIGNELLEFFLQHYLGATFAVGSEDTWFDLLSNTLGAFTAGILFVPLLQSHTKNIS